MALVSCPECRQQVSDQAVACPHCGFPFQKGIARGFSHPASVRPQASVATQPGDSTETAHREAIKVLLSSEGKIAAIKLARELRQLGLKEAKDYVESIEAGTPGLSRPRSKGCLGTGALLVGVAIVAAAMVLWALQSVL
ncbi:MAG TPA: ribosomal protein L7/L12 [Methylomirabilota bacterium]|nr:ribosomal protein L7/L12 [Methylomirabilota bacterium]